jgi:hypothetical protein
VQRARERRTYREDGPEDEPDEIPMFSVQEKLNCPRFSECKLVKNMQGQGNWNFDLIRHAAPPNESINRNVFRFLSLHRFLCSEISLQYFQDSQFECPILVTNKDGLIMQMPDPNTFTVRDVERQVGSRRLVDVMDVNTQKNFEMTLKQWTEYFTASTRDRLLNVISLEFSHTCLADYVEPPFVIKQLDWVNCIWPQYLKSQQIESTNSIGDMKYPKVQK